MLERASAAGYELAKSVLSLQRFTGAVCSVRLQGRRLEVQLLAPDAQAGLPQLELMAQGGNVAARLVLATWLTMNSNQKNSYSNQAKAIWALLAEEPDPAKQYEIARWYEVEVFPWDLWDLNRMAKRFDESGLVWNGKRLSVGGADGLSLQWFERAAQQGHLPAMLSAAGFVDRLPESSGRKAAFMFRDAKRDFENIKRAADTGSFAAQLWLAEAFLNGTGTIKDWTQSVTWAKKAATHPTAHLRRLAYAHSLLATSYAKGQGVERDSVVAYAWANVSVASGPIAVVDSAKEVLAQLEKILSAEQVAEAQGLSARWKPGQLIERAGATAGPAGASGPSTVAGAGKVVSQGTGFFVGTTGDIVTNSHVVKNCAEVRIPAMSTTGRIVVADTANDLAIVRAAVKSERVAKISAPGKVQQGQEIVVFGFPLDGFLPSSGNVTTGLVSALAGPGNNSSLIQITAPVQAGNSGGPVLDRHGNVAGVVVAKADALRIAKITGDLAQNINFAVSVATLRSFLETNRVEYRSPSFFAFEKDIAKVADAARDFTVKLECVR